MSKHCPTCDGHKYTRVPISFADDWRADDLEECPDCNPDGDYPHVAVPDNEVIEDDESNEEASE